MPVLYLTYRQLKAAKHLLAFGPDVIDWTAWDEFKELIASAPLETDEDDEDYALRREPGRL